MSTDSQHTKNNSDTPNANSVITTSADTYKTVLESFFGVVWETNATGKPIGDSVSWRTYTGQNLNNWLRNGWLEAVHPDELAYAQQQWNTSLQQQQMLDIDLRLHTADGHWCWANLKAKPIADQQGGVEKWVGVCIDIHDRKQSDQLVAESEERFRLFVTASSDVVYRMNADWSEMRNLVGKNLLPDTEAPTTSWLRKYVPEEEQSLVQAEIEKAIAQKSPFELEHRALLANGTAGWIRSRAVPVLNNQGDIVEWIGTAKDVTKRNQVLEALTDSEQALRSLVSSAPFPIGVYVGREMRIELANQAILQVWGKGKDVIGRRYADVLPELANQHIYDQLDQVYTTGVAFHARNQRIELVVDGALRPFYFNYSFTPLYTQTGQIYGVLNTAAEITDLVLVKQALENSQQHLESAIELAELATWSLDIPTRTLHYSQRFMEWLGLDESSATLDESVNWVPVPYRQSVQSAVEAAIESTASGRYDNEHPIINRTTGQVRVIHVQALVFKDESGQPLLLSGAAQDVTVQRKVQGALEDQVLQRTEELKVRNHELATSNEELAAANEELTAASEEITATNTKLEEVNQNLMRSNQNLEQFAYVASHDLQEPLRKIQQFGDLLKARYASAGDEELVYIDRMQVAANRMSLLIRDLLTFSRISTSQVKTSPVSLSKLMGDVLDTLSISIDESQASIQIDTLPTIPGDGLQLHQLFQNLLANAIKFREVDRLPVIKVTYRLVSRIDLPPYLKPERQVDTYCQIDVIDNGIGFDEKYIDRIFQVFQRLHGKNEFAGTGVGLAICQKVVANHGGAIMARSKPGEGSTFTVYLPV